MPGGASGGSGAPATPSGDVAAAAGCVDARRGMTAAVSGVTRVEGMLNRLSEEVAKAMRLSFVTWADEAGDQRTVPTRLAAVFSAMAKARNAALKEIETSGDDLRAMMQASVVAMGEVAARALHPEQRHILAE